MKIKTLGWIYLIIGLVPTMIYLFNIPQHILWFSNHIFIVFGIAILLNKRAWVLGSLCLGLIPELIWNIDYFLYLLTGGTVLGISDYMFTGVWWSNLFGFIHILVIPAGIYALFKMKGSLDKAWLYGLAHGIILYTISFLISEQYNLNCVHRSCIPLTMPYYIIIWPILFIGFFFISLFLLKRIQNL